MSVYNVKAWADGFGVRHASVPLINNAAEEMALARRNVRAALEERGASGKNYKLHLQRGRVTGHGTVLYSEATK